MIIKAQDNNIKHIINEEIASLIKSKKILKKDVLTETLNQAANDGVRYDQYLINNGYLTEEIAASLIANYLDFEYTNIDVIKYSDEIVSQLSFEFIENNKGKHFDVHCTAGISRSGAVCQFIFDFFNENISPMILGSFFSRYIFTNDKRYIYTYGWFRKSKVVETNIIYEKYFVCMLYF